MARTRARGSMETQSVVLMKDRFRTLASARKWLRSHGFLAPKVDETDESWRFRQEPPQNFQAKTFRSKYIDEGVLLVLAKRKRQNSSGASPRMHSTTQRNGLWWDGTRWVK